MKLSELFRKAAKIVLTRVNHSDNQEIGCYVAAIQEASEAYTGDIFKYMEKYANFSWTNTREHACLLLLLIADIAESEGN